MMKPYHQTALSLLLQTDLWTFQSLLFELRKNSSGT